MFANIHDQKTSNPKFHEISTAFFASAARKKSRVCNTGNLFLFLENSNKFRTFCASAVFAMPLRGGKGVPLWSANMEMEKGNIAILAEQRL